MRQIVVALGGSGSRLGSYSSFKPKSLLTINKTTFLEYLLLPFIREGCRDFLLLAGHLNNQISLIARELERKYLVNIEVSIDLVEVETGGRLNNAKSKLKFPIVFLYGDVFLPLLKRDLFQIINLESLSIFYYAGPLKKGKNNLRIEDNLVQNYDKNGMLEGNGVNCGYFIIDQKSMDFIGKQKSVEDYLLNNSNLNVKAFPVYNKYYTVGDPNRISSAIRYFSTDLTFLFDRDGTITKKNGPGEFLKEYDDIIWKSDTLRLFKDLNSKVENIALVTNQPSVGNGLISEKKMIEINHRIIEKIFETGGRLDNIFVCVHGWETDCKCKKPKPQLLYEAQHWFDLNWENVVYFGDMERDKLMADSVGCKYIDCSDLDNIYEIAMQSLSSLERKS